MFQIVISTTFSNSRRYQFGSRIETLSLCSCSRSIAVVDDGQLQYWNMADATRLAVTIDARIADIIWHPHDNCLMVVDRNGHHVDIYRPDGDCKY